MKRKDACIVAAFLMTAMPTWGLAQSNTETRLANLERVIAQLLQRVAALELQQGGTQSKSSVGSAGDPQEIRNWRKLQRNMGEDDVEQLLGSPTKVDTNKYRVIWYYGYPTGGQVRFDASSGEVEAWEEP